MVWKEVTIGDLGRVVTGRTPPSSEPHLFGKSYPFITPTDIDGQERLIETERFLSEAGKDSMERVLIPAGSVAYVCIASVGKVCVARQPSFTNQQINTVVVNEDGFDPAFVYYALRHATPRIKAIAGGAATPIINKSAFSEIAIRVPSLEVQRRIASILSAYDDLIENNTRRIAILEEMARRIYEEWFVRFRFPGHENLRMVESDLGLIPQGWTIEPLTSIAKLLSGFAFKSTTFSSAGPYGLITIKNVHDGVFIEEFTSRLATLPANMPEHCKLMVADILLSLTGNVGRCCLVTIDGCLLNQRVAKVQPVQPGDWAYSYLLFRSGAFQERLEAIASGVAQQNLSPVESQKLRMVTPSQELRGKFDESVSDQLRLVLALHRKNTILRTTRDLLLPKLISGELDVSVLPEPKAAAA